MKEIIVGNPGEIYIIGGNVFETILCGGNYWNGRILRAGRYYWRWGNIDGDILYEKQLEKRIDTERGNIVGGENN